MSTTSDRKIINSWEDLVGLESDKYKILVDLNLGCARIRPKEENDETLGDDYSHHHFYLTTHTSYYPNYIGCTQLLQKLGFNVELVCCD